jgi:citrate synthase
MSDWLTANEVMDRLGLKPQTLYAYVSRGLIEARTEPNDARKSLYRAADVGRLEYRKSRGRRRATVAEDAIAWGEPVLASAITTVARGRLWYRGQDAVLLSRTARLEDVARLLWACGDARFPPQRWAIPDGEILPLLFAALGSRAASDAPMRGRAPEALYFEAASLLDLLVDVVAGGPGRGPIHERLGRAWGCRPKGADLIRKALVLLADHELNASTFAARVTASTGASLAATVLTGLTTLSGPDHGGMASRVQAFMAEAAQDDAEAAVDAHLVKGEPIPGFGHPLYPEGDPRAQELLASFEPPRAYAKILMAAGTIAEVRPNIDFALTAMAETLDLPVDAPFLIFLIARSTGWIAHALEQHQTGRLIRPRARYIGPPPNG